MIHGALQTMANWRILQLRNRTFHTSAYACAWRRLWWNDAVWNALLCGVIVPFVLILQKKRCKGVGHNPLNPHLLSRLIGLARHGRGAAGYDKLLWRCHLQPLHGSRCSLVLPSFRLFSRGTVRRRLAVFLAYRRLWTGWMWVVITQSWPEADRPRLTINHARIGPPPGYNVKRSLM